MSENKTRPGRYWADLKRKLEKEGFSELPDKVGQLKMQSNKDGKMYLTDCVDTETLFRLIQSIPSPKAEPFRRWLAKVGYERILETQDPEIAIKRALSTYKAKMATSELTGSFPLTNADIDANVKSVSPGAYALGYTKGGSFYIDYVGRSDVDVADRLKDHVGNYKRFKYGYFSTAKAAFEKECHLYHDFSPKDNDIHPARPSKSDWECPVCTVFD